MLQSWYILQHPVEAFSWGRLGLLWLICIACFLLGFMVRGSR